MDNQLGQIFVQCDSDLMLARRIQRDVAERGRDVNGILEQSVPFCKYIIRQVFHPPEQVLTFRQASV